MRRAGYFDGLVGQKFNRLTVLAVAKRDDDSRTYLFCRCDCGVERTIIPCAVTGGKTTSCGCLGKENLIKANTKHGHSSGGKLTPEYLSWSGMMARCYNPNVRGWLNWGGRGIKVCRHWKDNFDQFFKDMGTKPKGLTLDRRDNNKGYLCPLCCPPKGNCEWVTWSVQLKNRRRMRLGNELKIEAGKRVWKRKTSAQKKAQLSRLQNWWASKTPEEKRLHGIAAAASRWGKVRDANTNA